MRILRQLVSDAVSLARTYSGGRVSARLLGEVVLHDGYVVLAMSRLRELGRRWHVPGVNRVLRLAQVGVYGIEIGKGVELGEGVVFMHTLGTVIGGDAQLGARVLLMGNITIGTVNNSGYPRVGSDVQIGAGARILGPVTIGDGAVIGANAVVVTDVPPGAMAIGVPATVRPRVTERRAVGHHVP